MFMLRMSQNDDLVYAVLVNEKAKNAAVSDNGIEGNSEECSLLECGLDGANILQQVEIYAFKSDGQFEVRGRMNLPILAPIPVSSRLCYVYARGPNTLSATSWSACARSCRATTSRADS